MKCGSCRTSTADVFKKINDDDNLFEILKTLNAKRAYNPKYKYFCEQCIQLATNKLSHRVTNISSQIANSFTVNSESTGTNESEGSKDEYDEIVSQKRVFSEKGTPLIIPQSRTKRPAANEPIKSKPCPKRFKKPLAPIQLDAIAEQSSVGQQKSTVAQPKNSTQDGSDQQSSGSLSADNMMMVFSQNNSSRSTDSNNSLEELPVVNTPTDHLHITNSPSNNSLEEQPVASTPTGRLRRNKNSTSNNAIEELPIASTATARLRRNTSSSSKDSPEEQPNARTSTERLRRSKDSLSNKDRADKGRNVASHSRSEEKGGDQTSGQHARPNKDVPAAVPGRTGKSPIDPQRSRATSDRLNTANAASSGTLAPAPKTPRIRQPNADIARNLQNYFSLLNVDVNNYSRTLAG